MKKTAAGFLMFFLFAGCPLAQAESPEQEVHITIKDHQFSPAEVKVKANIKIKLLVSNEDKTAEEFEASSLNRESNPARANRDDISSAAQARRIRLLR
jgi:hypothetical protein